jgi:thiamine-phosphate pyrophosphorylase
VLTCYITGRSQFAGSEAERRARLLESIRRAAAAGVDCIQLRERDLTARELEALARQALAAVRAAGPAKLLINHRTDIALAVGADGVHLRGDDVAVSDARAVAAAANPGRPFLVAVSCHSAEELRRAEREGADFAVLAPIFEKAGADGRTLRQGIGLDELRRAAQQRIPVFGLGGVTEANAALCAEAGAAGVAGIRLFQQSKDLARLVRSLREL